MFKIIARDGKARTGVLKIGKKKAETPFFMPVSSNSAVRFISTEDLEEIGIKATISNAFILHLRPGEKIIRKIGGIGKFMNFSGINVTDSGGFQMYSKEIFISSSNKGVIFKNPASGEKIFMTPEKDMKIQLDIGSEIAMCLDSMPLFSHSKKEIEEAVRKTTLWAGRCKKEHDKLQKKQQKENKQLLFGIMQGGIYPDLREKSAEDIVKLNFDGYSIGGLGLGEPREKQYQAVEFQKKFIPENKPVYLMGIGTPSEILEAISLGVDMFDSRLPTQNARRGTLFTSKGKLRIFNSRYKTDKKPIDENCGCFVCRNYSRAFIRHHLKEQSGTGRRLATYHNLYYLSNLMKDARNAIKKKKFSEFKKKIQKIYQD